METVRNPLRVSSVEKHTCVMLMVSVVSVGLLGVYVVVMIPRLSRVSKGVYHVNVQKSEMK